MVHIANIKKNYFLAHGKKIQYFNSSPFIPKFPEATHVNIINLYNVYSSSPLIHILLKVHLLLPTYILQLQVTLTHFILLISEIFHCLNILIFK